MRVKVTSQGIFIPKQWLEGIDEVEIRREKALIVIEPVGAEDPIFGLGAEPIVAEVDDASIHHDRYLTAK